MREGVPTGRSEQRPREAILVGLRNDTRDVAEHGLERPTARAALLVVEEPPGRRELEVVAVLRPRVAPRRRPGHVRHRGDRSLHNVPLLQRGVPTGRQLGVVLLELDEVLVDLLESRLDLVQLVLFRMVQETVQVGFDHLGVWDTGELHQEKSQDALHLVDSLYVLLVRPVQLAGIHVLELHFGVGPDDVDELPGPVDGQHQRAVFHGLRPEDPHPRPRKSVRGLARAKKGAVTRRSAPGPSGV
mmetsp:Transcript_43492/g.131580  ORF Transcript_43492/g.131580 Transcript_43492/m.131580 type:complete len:244 (+) Transcript_43492:1976-2707(+)